MRFGGASFNKTEQSSLLQERVTQFWSTLRDTSAIKVLITRSVLAFG